jgi:hypothetical protein
MTLDANTVLRNIETCYAKASPEELTLGRHWYAVARTQCQQLARKHGVPVNVVCAIVACLSPNAPWSRNTTDADNLLTCYAKRQPISWVSAVTYRKNVAKAWRIRATGDVSILRGPKVTAFYHCLVSSHSNYVCVDSHIYSVASGVEYTAQTTPHITGRNHVVIVNAFRRVAKLRHTMPYRVQATCWVVRRRVLTGTHNQLGLPYR